MVQYPRAKSNGRALRKGVFKSASDVGGKISSHSQHSTRLALKTIQKHTSRRVRTCHTHEFITATYGVSTVKAATRAARAAKTASDAKAFIVVGWKKK